MPQAKFTVSIPESVWVRDLSRAYPDAVFRVVTTLVGPDGGTGLLEVEAGDPLSVLTGMREMESVRQVELLWTREEVALVQMETDDPLLLLPVLRAGVPLKTPFEIRDGEATWELSTSSDRLSDLGGQLESLGIEFEVEYVRAFGTSETDDLLTDRQRQVVLRGIERGYYDTPREETLTGLAADLDISKATASDILHRAEGKVLKWFAREYLAG